jgi:transposase
MRAYSQDLRARVLKACDSGLSTREVATKYEVSESWVRRLKQRRRETGSIEPKPQRYGSPPKWTEHAEAIATAVRRAPDDSVEQIRTRLGLPLSHATLWRAIKALGFTLKKSSEGRRTGPPRRGPRPAALAGRHAGVGRHTSGVSR